MTNAFIPDLENPSLFLECSNYMDSMTSENKSFVTTHSMANSELGWRGTINSLCLAHLVWIVMFVYKNSPCNGSQIAASVLETMQYIYHIAFYKSVVWDKRRILRHHLGANNRKMNPRYGPKPQVTDLNTNHTTYLEILLVRHTKSSGKTRGSNDFLCEVKGKVTEEVVLSQILEKG